MKKEDLNFITFNRFVGIFDGNILSWCPIMDILAVSMNKMSIWVFRLNGERIYSINNKSPIIDISWQLDGKCFCVSGIDGFCKIYDSNTGLLINTVGTSGAKPCLIGWFKHGENEKKGEINTLFRVDVLNHLPRLAYTVDLERKTTSGYINEINNTDSNLLTCMFAIMEDSTLSLTINNHFTVDRICISETLKFLSYANKLGFHSSYLLAQDTEHGTLNLLELSIKVPTLFNYRKNFYDVLFHASKVVSILNLFEDLIQFLNRNFSSCTQLLDRQLSNLSDSLYPDEDMLTSKSTTKERQSKIINCLYDILMTGLIPEKLRDFWMNQLGERQLKRLGKSGNSTYDLLKKVLFEYLIPLIERLIIIFNDSQGYSLWFETLELNTNGVQPMKFSYEKLNGIIEKLQSFLKLLYQLIWAVNEEQRLFNQFLDWIQTLILDRLAKEDDLASYYESFDPTYKVSDLMTYIEYHLFQTELFEYFEIDTSGNSTIFLKESRFNVLKNFVSLQQSIDNDFLQAIKDFIGRSVSITSLVTLETDCFDKGKLDVFHKHGYVTTLSLDCTTLSIYRFDSINPAKYTKKTLKIPRNIISYDFVDEETIAILIEEESYGVFQVIDASALLSITDNTIERTCVTKRVQFEADDKDNIKTPKWLAINRGSKLACLLDLNRRNYAVVKID